EETEPLPKTFLAQILKASDSPIIPHLPLPPQPEHFFSEAIADIIFAFGGSSECPAQLNLSGLFY
ncbi:hypothetical protein, partial [Coprococcus comes]|uniref:hypothetical protein n=1 Tax=Coprococcus comes TaxID=410072 RepID=UPI001A9C1939